MATSRTSHSASVAVNAYFALQARESSKGDATRDRLHDEPE